MEILKVLTVVSTMVCLSGINGMNEKNESAQIPVKDELQDVNEKLFSDPNNGLKILKNEGIKAKT